jgi:hypothetical protein
MEEHGRSMEKAWRKHGEAGNEAAMTVQMRSTFAAGIRASVYQGNRTHIEESIR